MKFTMNSKELKTMLEKVISVINKKSTLAYLTRVGIRVDEDGTVTAFGTDLEQWLEIKSDAAYDTRPGLICIDVDDIKVISKLSGSITFEDTSHDSVGKINIKCGKRCVCIPAFEVEEQLRPPVLESENLIFTFRESWLFETIIDLGNFISCPNTNIMNEVFHFDPKNKRVEALDGYCIGMRSMTDSMISSNEEVLLHCKCIPIFKRVLNGKSDKEVRMYQDKKYVHIAGNGFSYIEKRVEGKYYDVSRILRNDYNYSFTPSRDAMLENMKYVKAFCKNDRNPVMFHSVGGKMLTYYRNERYEIFDELDTDDVCMGEDIYIGFNPSYLVEIFNIVDSYHPMCRGMGSKGMFVVEGEEYHFGLMPINVTNTRRKEMEKCILESKAS